jgi:hypothetical protein
VHLFPVRIEATPDALPDPAGPASRAVAPRRPGVIEIEVSNGVRVTVDEGVGAVALRRVISVLRG